MGILILTLNSMSHTSSAPWLFVIANNDFTKYVYCICIVSIAVQVITVSMGSKCLYCHRILLLDRCVDRGPDLRIGQL
jgi:hypothetical protein